jgi:uncharacterized protein (DUF1330 family)
MDAPGPRTAQPYRSESNRISFKGLAGSTVGQAPDPPEKALRQPRRYGKGYGITPDRAAPAYANLPDRPIASNGGRFLAPGGTVKTYEQGIAQRTVGDEFDSVEQAIAAHDSPPIKRHSPCLQYV